jgi:hypothetical protein
MSLDQFFNVCVIKIVLVYGGENIWVMISKILDHRVSCHVINDYLTCPRAVRQKSQPRDL